MGRRAKNPTELMKWRYNQGLETGQLHASTGLPQSTINRIERGHAVTRTKAAKYLKHWGGDLNNLAMFPNELKIIDEGPSVRIRFIQQTE